MENQLILYRTKKNAKKIILIILLGIFISFSIFILSIFSGAFFSMKAKWNGEGYVNLQTKGIDNNSNNSHFNKN